MTLDWKRWEPLSGIAFVACFVASVVVSSVPAVNAPDKEWLAAYASRGQQTQHLVTGFLLVYAAIFLMVFLNGLWTRIAKARRPAAISPLPLVAAGVAAACIAVGGVLMATISTTTLFNSAPEPGADLLRFANDIGFGMVSVAGMSVAALSIAGLSVQAHAAGIFGRRFLIFGLVVAVLLLGAVAFFPIVALLIWLIVVATRLTRGNAVTVQRPAARAPAPES